jgi:hypothetical protein
MTFIEWTERGEHSSQNAANPKAMKIREELNELVFLKRIIVEAKTFQPQEKSHAKK